MIKHSEPSERQEKKICAIDQKHSGQLAHICGELLHGGLGRNSKF